MRWLIRDVGTIYRFVGDPELTCTHFPDERRKSRGRILVDMLAWRVRRREVNRYYFCWGLDRRAAPAPSSLISYRDFRRLRDARNRIPVGTGRSNYTLVLDDKFLFSLFLEAMGHAAPAVIGVAQAGTITWLRPPRAEPLASIRDREGGLDVFCKDVLGEKGESVFWLEVRDRSIRINGQSATLEDLARRFSRKSILQQRVVQHPELAALYGGSINTVRIVTVRHAGEVVFFSIPVLRTGVGGSVVDNWSAGGLMVLVDPESGRLRGPGRSDRRGTTARHPDSGVAFDGFQIPHFHRAMALARSVHEDLPELHSVGWDIAITADGPTVIEGNHNWSGALRIGLDPDFKREFIRLFGTP